MGLTVDGAFKYSMDLHADTPQCGSTFQSPLDWGQHEVILTLMSPSKETGATSATLHITSINSDTISATASGVAATGYVTVTGAVASSSPVAAGADGFSSSSGTNVGVIVGAVVGSIVGMLLVTLALIVCLWRRRRSQNGA